MEQAQYSTDIPSANAFSTSVSSPGNLSAQRLLKFIERCRRVGLPPVTVSPRCAKVILPARANGEQADHYASLDFVWSLRGAILGLVPCVRTSSLEGVSYKIKLWATTAEGEPTPQYVTAVVDTSLEGEQRLRLVLPEEQVTPPAANNTILLVENDPDIAELEQLMLEAAGFRVLWTPNGLDGLRRAQAEPFAAVVLDAEVPGLDGFEICRRLKADPTTSSLPIVFLSGYPSAARLALIAGANKFLPKPHGVSALASCICQLLNC